MSEHEPYAQQPDGQVQAPSPSVDGHPRATAQRTNTMAILGLVFAFVFSPLGIVFSALGLKQTKERDEGGRGLAVAGTVLSVVFTLVALVGIVLAVTVLRGGAHTAAARDSAAASVSQSATLDGTPAKQRVAAACRAVVPAAKQGLADLGSAQTLAEVQTALATMQQALQAAADASGDQTFIAEVHTFVADLQAVSTAAGNGQDPSSFLDTLSTDGTAIDGACSAVGVSG